MIYAIVFCWLNLFFWGCLYSSRSVVLRNYKVLSRNGGAWLDVIELYTYILEKNPKNYTVGVILWVSHIPWGRLSSPDPGPASTESKIKARRQCPRGLISWGFLLGGLRASTRRTRFWSPKRELFPNFQKGENSDPSNVWLHIGSFYEFMCVHFRFWTTSIRIQSRELFPGPGRLLCRHRELPMPNKQHRSFRHRGGTTPMPKIFHAP